MIRFLAILASALALAAIPNAADAQQIRADYQAMAAFHAKANGVPIPLVHRIIMRESKYDATLLGRGGAIGLMQIKLATARGVGYTGTAEGLRDPNTNLTYGVKYLAGAYHAANGDHNRAVSYYAGGYYYVAKRQRRDTPHHAVMARSTEPAPQPEAAQAAISQATSVEASAQPAAAQPTKP